MLIRMSCESWCRECRAESHDCSREEPPPPLTLMSTASSPLLLSCEGGLSSSSLAEEASDLLSPPCVLASCWLPLPIAVSPPCPVDWCGHAFFWPLRLCPVRRLARASAVENTPDSRPPPEVPTVVTILRFRTRSGRWGARRRQNYARRVEVPLPERVSLLLRRNPLAGRSGCPPPDSASSAFVHYPSSLDANLTRPAVACEARYRVL
mmetsp:Transcript_10757/g.27090  ORF Transcript_10757/g.27090 Transcript_10757/m.27090 type:complete len:208 (+) Transcript_10757:444-1067(+)